MSADVFDVVVVTDFAGSGHRVFEARTPLFLGSSLERSGRSRNGPRQRQDCSISSRNRFAQRSRSGPESGLQTGSGTGTVSASSTPMCRRTLRTVGSKS
jgi:hypothetical protein